MRPPSLHLSLILPLLSACSSDGTSKSSAEDSSDTDTDADSGDADTGASAVDPDFNGDGMLRVLVLGTSRSVESGVSFAADELAGQLETLFLADEDAPDDVRVVAEDIYMERDVTIGLGGGGDEYTYTHRSHSLLQYYYWPDGQAERFDRLTGEGDHRWDYVVIGGDPFIVAHTPGYYALGAHRVAAKVAEGSGQPLLLMMWPTDGIESSVRSFEELTYRTGDGAPVDLPVVPAGLGWDALPETARDPPGGALSSTGAEVAAATIYAYITSKHPSASGDPVGDAAHSAATVFASQGHYEGVHSFASPFGGCGVEDALITYNHTGSSSESGILEGLRWVFERAPQTLEAGSDPLITFNYGRANTNFEPDKRYKIDPELFSFSFGFPMQDHGNHGDTSMLYGLDYRDSGVVNDTDLGVAHYMLQQGELPHARAIPIRTLFARMKEAMPDQSAYRDAWHMHQDLDKSIAGYMHTLLTGTCASAVEPEDATSADWRTWKAHRIGCDTAWTFLTLDGNSPF